MGYLDNSTPQPDTSSSNPDAYQAQAGSGGYLGGMPSDQAFNNLVQTVAPSGGPKDPAAMNQQAADMNAKGVLNWNGVAAPTQYNSIPIAPDENAKVSALLSSLPPDMLTGDFMTGFFQGQANRRANIESQSAQTREMVQEQSEQTDLQLRNGMQQAMGVGGFNGVIDYLKVADPVKAMAFQNAKDDMDQSMMKTDVMRAQTPVDIAKAMVEGYGVIGKMGSAILQSPDADRSALYQQIKPILQTVLGKDGTPDQWGTDAAHTLLLGAAQASPSNDIYALQKQSGLSDDTSNKLYHDIQVLQSQGATTDNNPLMALKVQQFQAASATAQSTKVELASKQLTLQTNQAKQAAGGQINTQDILTTSNVKKNWQDQLDAQLKPHNAWFNNVSAPAHIAESVLDKDPNNFQAQIAFVQPYILNSTRGKSPLEMGNPAYQGSGLMGEIDKKAAYYNINSPNYGKMPDGHGGYTTPTPEYRAQMAITKADIQNLKAYYDAGDDYHNSQSNYISQALGKQYKAVAGSIADKAPLIYPEQYRGLTSQTISAKTAKGVNDMMKINRPDLAQKIIDQSHQYLNYVTPSK